MEGMLDEHKMSFLANTQCTACVNFIYLKLLDQDIDHELFKNRCKECKNIVNEFPVTKLTSKAQRIHVIGNHWPLVNNLKHRKFAFFCGNQKLTDKDSVCITDTTAGVNKIERKLIITQGYESMYDLTSVDYLLVEKKHIKTPVPFDIPDKGYLVFDIRNGQEFYTES